MIKRSNRGLPSHTMVHQRALDKASLCALTKSEFFKLPEGAEPNTNNSNSSNATVLLNEACNIPSTTSTSHRRLEPYLFDEHYCKAPELGKALQEQIVDSISSKIYNTDKAEKKALFPTRGTHNKLTSTQHIETPDCPSCDTSQSKQDVKLQLSILNCKTCISKQHQQQYSLATTRHDKKVERSSSGDSDTNDDDTAQSTTHHHTSSSSTAATTIESVESLFHRDGILGEGTYGVVYRAIKKETKEVVALKKLRWDSQSDGIPATSVREVVLLRNLIHPNVVRLKGVHYEARHNDKHPPRIFLEFEYVELDLRKYMKTFPQRRIPIETVKIVMYQLLRGLAYCHSKRVIHRDIKPNNILLRIVRSNVTEAATPSPPPLKHGIRKRPASTFIPLPCSQRRRYNATTYDEATGPNINIIQATLVDTKSVVKPNRHVDLPNGCSNDLEEDSRKQTDSDCDRDETNQSSNRHEPHYNQTTTGDDTAHHESHQRRPDYVSSSSSKPLQQQQKSLNNDNDNSTSIQMPPPLLSSSNKCLLLKQDEEKQHSVNDCLPSSNSNPAIYILPCDTNVHNQFFNKQLPSNLPKSSLCPPPSLLHSSVVHSEQSVEEAAVNTVQKNKSLSGLSLETSSSSSSISSNKTKKQLCKHLSNNTINNNSIGQKEKCFSEHHNQALIDYQDHPNKISETITSDTQDLASNQNVLDSKTKKSNNHLPLSLSWSTEMKSDKQQQNLILQYVEPHSNEDATKNTLQEHPSEITTTITDQKTSASCRLKKIEKEVDEYEKNKEEILSVSPISTDPAVKNNDQSHYDEVEVKIADFGLARIIPFPLRPLTREVVTLWYRAPEILMGSPDYTSSIDMWAVGCVFAELLFGRAMFAGDVEIDTLFKIFQLLGTPDESIWKGVTKLPYYKPVWPKWKRRSDRYDYFRENLDEDAKDLLDKLLMYDYRYRITAAEALKHPWFNSIIINKSALSDKII